MTHDQGNLKDGATGGCSPVFPDLRKQPLAGWHSPRVTVIDIRRTMLVVGSVIDGISGSI